MTDQLKAPPVLSTPDTHVFGDPTTLAAVVRSQRLTEKEVYDVYEIQRTADEIHEGGWQRIALQFPDDMLHDAPRVVGALQAMLEKLSEEMEVALKPINEEDSTGFINDAANRVQEIDVAKQEASASSKARRRLFILADTSYGACCVDEIAAEHVEAEVVVHYGRSCLSPTARLPVIYVFTTRPLQLSPVLAAFEEIYSEKDSNIILMADVTYSDHISAVLDRLKALGYSNIFSPSIIHDPSSLIPNRTIPPLVHSGDEYLKDYSLFHISEPPASLLLTLSSRLHSMYIYPTRGSASTTPKSLQAQTSQQLRRRYALLTSLNTCSIFGILINTLSVKNYLHTIKKIQAQLTGAGKKYYTFVVGKVNAAKVANFSEIGGWVVVGCWESSLIESADFFRPIITPFELGLALMSDDRRIWTGEWRGDYNSIKDVNSPNDADRRGDENSGSESIDEDEEESEPPEFDLRTGRYISHSRPMLSKSINLSQSQSPGASSALIKRGNSDLATINGTASPGAEYLRAQRTWKGLGSDFEIAYEDEEKGAAVEEGRRGVARGYTVGEGDERR